MTAHLPTVKPLFMPQMTVEQRAALQLVEIREQAAQLTGDDLFSYRMALEELRDLAKDYGAMGELALRQYLLEQAVGAAALPLEN